MGHAECEYEAIKLDCDGSIATITLNRPEKRNPLSIRTAYELTDALGQIDRRDDVRAVILTGAGQSFCAGMDASELTGEIGIGDHERLVMLFDQLVLRLRSLEVATIAAVNGHALGAGLALAVACDIRIASEKATVGAMMVRRGVSAADMGISYILPRLVGAAWAAELMLTGEVIDAAKAERIGLFTHVVPGDQLMATAYDLAGRIASGPPLGIKFTKRGLYRSMWQGLQSDLEWEAAVQTICSRSADFAEAWKAYFEKRPPEFKGN